jgi:serine/threonine protein kinase
VVLAPDDFDVTLVALEAGDVLSGRYRLVRKLGRGGMGVVWLADDMVLDEQVALKLLPTPLARDARSVARMKDEAKRNLRLTHPHIVRLMNFERDDARGGMAFLIMQYVKGQTLNDVLAKLPEGVPLKHVRKWAVQLASALDYAHEQGVLHRDIKPSNVMIDRQGNASLMDFGIAREAKDTMTHVTGRDSSGTLPYMSPQQVAGLNHPSNDIYALAATLYEALCGNPPFHTGDIVDQIKHRTRRRSPTSRRGETMRCWTPSPNVVRNVRRLRSNWPTGSSTADHRVDRRWSSDRVGGAPSRWWSQYFSSTLAHSAGSAGNEGGGRARWGRRKRAS